MANSIYARPDSITGPQDLEVGPRGTSQPINSITDEPSFLEATAGGLFLGLREDPLLQPVIDGISDMVGYDSEAIKTLEDYLANSDTADVFKVIGEIAPFVAGGVGAYSLGRLGARALLKSVGPKVGGSFATAAARLSQVGTAEAGASIPLTAAQRLTEIAGGAVATGGFDATRELAGGATIPEAAKAAAITALFVGGAEGLLFGGARAFGLGREVARGGVVARAEAIHGPQRLKELRRFDRLIDKQKNAVEKINGTFDTEASLLRARGAGPQEAFEVGERLVNSGRKATLRLNRLEADRTAYVGRIADDPTVAYASEQVFNPSGIRGLLATAAQQVSRTPESLIGKAGVVGSNVIKAGALADNRSIAGRGMANVLTTKIRANVAKEIGIHRSGKKAGHVWAGLRDAWESGGEDGVRVWAKNRPKVDGEKVIAQLNKMERAVARVDAEKQRLGISLVHTAEDLQRAGVAKRVPQVVRGIPDNDLYAAIDTSKLSKVDKEALKEALTPKGLRRLGNDAIRSRPGTTAEKIAEGIPLEDDMWSAWFSYLAGSHRQIEFAKLFGPSGELKGKFLDAIVAEGGSKPYFNTLIDAMLGVKHHHGGWGQLADTMLGYQIASKLTLAVIPNMSQGANTLMFAGFKNTLRGLRNAIKNDPDERRVLQMVALAETVPQGVSRQFAREITTSARSGIGSLDAATNMADLLAYNTLRLSGFSTVERWNRVMSGHTGLAVFRDNVAKAINGRLRGENLERVRRQMRSLNIDIDGVVKGIREGKIADPMKLTKGNVNFADPTVKALQELEAQAAFRAAQLTQFIPSTTRRPLFWEHPLGRVMFQFKNFALGQARFLKDVTMKEAAAGNLKPLAYFLSVYPIAGELVKGTRALAVGKPREDEGGDRLLNDMLAVGGLGIVTDALVQARFGRALEFVTGPTAADMGDVAEAMSRGDLGAIGDQITRQPAFKAASGFFGSAIMLADETASYLSEMSGSDVADDEPTSFDRLQLERVLRKQ